MAQLIQERRLGEHRLAPEATLVLAGNRATDRAGAQTDPTHVIDRVFLVNVIADLDIWIKWALKNGVKPEIVSFLRFKPDVFSQFDPQARKNATPRGWTKVSTFLDMKLPDEIEMAAIQGQVGPGPAIDFKSYLNVYRDMPDIDRMIANPDDNKMPNPMKKPDLVYAICGSVAHKTTKENIDNVFRLLEHLPGEFAMMVVTDAVRRDSDLQNTKAFEKFITVKGGGRSGGRLLGLGS